MNNPFFRETLDETGNRYEEEIPLDNRSLPIPDGKVAQSFPMDTGSVIEPVPIVNDIQTNSEFLSALMSVENSIKSGFDEDSGLWTPHKSAEGGTDTLAYGHKLTDAENRSGKIKVGRKMVDYRKGLTEDQVTEILSQDVSKAERKLGRIKGFDKLPQKYKDVLTNISFNAGRVTEKGWPNLLKAMRAGDDYGVREEMVTSYKDRNGDRVRLDKRANHIANAVGLM